MIVAVAISPKRAAYLRADLVDRQNEMVVLVTSDHTTASALDDAGVFDVIVIDRPERGLGRPLSGRVLRWLERAARRRAPSLESFLRTLEWRLRFLARVEATTKPARTRVHERRRPARLEDALDEVRRDFRISQVWVYDASVLDVVLAVFGAEKIVLLR